MTVIPVDITVAVNKLVGSHNGLSQADAISQVIGELGLSVSDLQTSAPLVTTFYVIEGAKADGVYSTVGSQPASAYQNAAQFAALVKSGFSYTNSLTYRITPVSTVVAPFIITV